MSKLLEVFGKAITVNAGDLIWYWLNAKISTKHRDEEVTELDEYSHDLDHVLEKLSKSDSVQSWQYIRGFLEKYPESCNGRMLAAALFLQNNDLESALKQLQSVYMRKPNNTMALYALGHCYERLGCESEAFEFYQDCTKFKSYLQLPRQRLAAMHLKNGDLKSAISQYRELTSEYPDDISSSIALGYLELANLDYEKAAEIFDTAILMHPDNFQSDNEYEDIQSMIEIGEYTQALDQISIMIEQLGDQPEMYVKLGDIYQAAGADKEAVSAYEKALRLQPNYMQACLRLGTAHLKASRQSLAAEMFNRAVELNDELVDAYIGLATAEILSGKEKKALKTISFAGALQQNSTVLFAETASLKYQAAMFEGFSSFDMPNEHALINYTIEAHRQQVLEVDCADTHYKLGVLLMATKTYDEAKQEFKKAIEKNPTHYRARTKLAVCHYETDCHAEAIDILVEPDILDADMLDLHYKTSLFFADRVEFAKSIDKLKKLTFEGIEGENTLTSLQVVLENLGLVDRASTSWDRLCYTTNRALLK